MADTDTIEPTPQEMANAAKAQALADRPKVTLQQLVEQKFREAGRLKDAPGAPAKAVEKGPARDETGKFAPKGVVEKEQPDAKGEAKAKPDAEGGKAAEKAQKEASAREERAITALRRAKTPQSMIDRMTDEERIQMGTALAEQQAAIDRKFSEQGKAKSESRGEESVKAEQPSKKPDDLPTPDAKAIAEALALDDEGTAVLNGWAKSMIAPLAEQLSEARVANEAMADQMGEMALDSVLDRLTGEYPELKVPETRKEVRATAARLADSDAYDDAEDFMSGIRQLATDSIWRVCRESIQARRAGADKANGQAKSAGQPTVSTRQGDGSLSTEHPVVMAKRLLDAGYTAEQARVEVNRRFSK